MRRLPDWLFYVLAAAAAWVLGALFLVAFPGCAGTQEFYVPTP